ncbi:MAG: CoA transferase [Chloroflexi bacterium]|nr:CoA transferase [Chloroflexota bacterium]
MTQLPLRNVRVLELTHIVAGPAAGIILGDLGADVIKIEPPDALDPGRMGTGRNGSYFYLNRNKRHIVLDLKNEEALAVFYRLACSADVFVENMGPGVTDRLGIGYGELSRRNPRIIYCSVKGYLSGPYEDRSSMDEMAQMMSGLAFMTGPLGRPLRAGASITDLGAATFGVVGILAALLERQSTGKGQFITSGLFETALFYVGQHMAQSQFSGQPSRPMAERDRHSPGGYPAYDLFECAGGRQVFIAAFNFGQWKKLCEVLGLQDFSTHPDLKDVASVGKARPWTMPRLEETIRTLDAKTLVAQLSAQGVPATVVNTPESVLDETHVHAPRRLLNVGAGEKSLSVPTLPFESDDYQFSVRHDPTVRPGSDTREVLAEAGYSPDEIERLLQTGAAKVL